MSAKNVKPAERSKKVIHSSICNIDGSSASDCSKEKNQMKSNATKIKQPEIRLIEVGNWEVEANANAKVPELSDEQPLPNVKKNLKPQIKMSVKNVKPAEKSKKDTVPDLYSSVTKLFQCQPCGDRFLADKIKSSKDFENHLASVQHQKVMKELESLHANTAGQIRMYAQFLENRKTAGKTGLKVSQR